MKYEKLLRVSRKTEGAEDFLEDTDEINLSRPKGRPVYLRVVPVVTFVFIIATVLWIITHSISSLALHAPQTSSREFHCGNTTSDAKALGCEFDLLSYTWMPKACIDRETSVEFEEWIRQPERQFGAWPFFADKEGRQRIENIEDLSQRAGLKTHTTQEEHLGHCTFMLRRLHRVRQMQGVEIAMDNVEHIVHCSNEILRGLKGPDPVDENRLASIFIISFNSCRIAY